MLLLRNCSPTGWTKKTTYQFKLQPITHTRKRILIYHQMYSFWEEIKQELQYMSQLNVREYVNVIVITNNLFQCHSLKAIDHKRTRPQHYEIHGWYESISCPTRCSLVAFSSNGKVLSFIAVACSFMICIQPHSQPPTFYIRLIFLNNK